MDLIGREVLWLIVALGATTTFFLAVIAFRRDLAGVLARRFLTHLRLNVVTIIMACAVLGTTLAVAALTVVMGISTGFQAEFQRRVLGVNAHVIVLKYGFTEYRRVMERVRQIPGVIGVNPFVLNEMMLVADMRLAGVLLKGVDPFLMPQALDLPDYMREGSIGGLRTPGALPPELRRPSWDHLRDNFLGEDENYRPPSSVGSAEDGEQREADLGIPGVVPVTGDRDDAEDNVLDDAVAEALDIELDEEGPLEEDAVLPGLILGRTLADELDLEMGETVRVMSPLSGSSVALWAPDAGPTRSRQFRVVGIFYSGFDEYDRRLVLVDIFEAQTFFDQGDIATGIELRLEDPDDAPWLARELQNVLGREVYQVIDWQDLNRNLFAALHIQKVALTMVVSALVLVAGLLIIATLVMLIYEKKPEIAVLKAMGATDSSVMRVFVFIGLFVGSLGTFLGITLGYGICQGLILYGWDLDPDVYLIDRLPVAIVFSDYVIIATVSLVISFLSTLVPSWLTAARLKPVDGLRAE